MLKNLKRHKDEDILKGQAVKNQKVLCFYLISSMANVQWTSTVSWWCHLPLFNFFCFLNFLLFLVKALWDKTLEFRFLLQKAFSSSNRLPRVHCNAYFCFNSGGLSITFMHCWWHDRFCLQEPVRSSFCESDEGVSAAYSDLITSSKKTLDSLLELQEVSLLLRIVFC